MSTFEVNAPYTTGAPSLTSCNKEIAASASAFCCVTAPTTVTGAIAPASVKGVIITACPRAAARIAPSSIGQSCLSGDDELIFVNI